MSTRFGVRVHFVDGREPKEDWSTGNRPERDPSNWSYTWNTLVPFYHFYNDVSHVEVIERLI